VVGWVNEGCVHEGCVVMMALVVVFEIVLRMVEGIWGFEVWFIFIINFNDFWV
jgi:hypothetical protein